MEAGLFHVYSSSSNIFHYKIIMFYLMKMSHSLYKVVCNLISSSSVCVRERKGGRNAFSEGVKTYHLKFKEVISFLKLDFNGGRFPTISDDRVYTVLSASF